MVAPATVSAQLAKGSNWCHVGSIGNTCIYQLSGCSQRLQISHIMLVFSGDNVQPATIE